MFLSRTPPGLAMGRMSRIIRIGPVVTGCKVNSIFHLRNGQEEGTNLAV